MWFYVSLYFFCLSSFVPFVFLVFIAIVDVVQEIIIMARQRCTSSCSHTSLPSAFSTSLTSMFYCDCICVGKSFGYLAAFSPASLATSLVACHRVLFLFLSPLFLLILLSHVRPVTSQPHHIIAMSNPPETKSVFFTLCSGRLCAWTRCTKDHVSGACTMLLGALAFVVIVPVPRKKRNRATILKYFLKK